MHNNSGVTTIGAGRAVTQDQNWLNGQLHKTHTGHIDTHKSVLSVHQERATWVRVCNYVKFQTEWNSPPVLTIVTRTAQAA